MDNTNEMTPPMTRRQMLRMLGGSAAVMVLAACGGTPAAAPTAAPAAPTAAPAAPTAAPAAPTAAPAPTTAMAEPTAAMAAPTATVAATAKPTPVPVPTGVTGLSEGSADAGAFAGAPDLKGKLSLQKLNIAFIPAEDAAKTLSDNKEALAYLKQVFGIEVTGAVGTSYSAVIEAMRAKKVDIAFYGPFSYILAVIEAKAEALIQGQTADGMLATYTSLIIAPADSTITKLEDIKGKNFSFVDPASTSGHLVPSYTLLKKANLKETTDYKPIYAGSHPASYQAVANKKVDAGAIASDTFAKGVKEGSIDEKAVKIVDTSFPIPGSPIAIRGDLPQADKDLLLQAFLAVNDLSDSALLKKLSGGLGVGAIKLVKADDKAYDDLRQIPAAIGIELKGLVK
jgi:phosphonate transport system substrate-binding protein